MRADKRFARAFQLAPYNVRDYTMYARVFQSHVADRLEYARIHYISAYIIRGESEGAREPFISAHALSILKQVFQCMRGVMERANQQFVNTHARDMLTV